MTRAVSEWPRWLFRGLVGAELLLALGQPLLAGAFLSGHYELLAWHRTNATVTGLVAIAMTAAALLVRVLRGGPWWPTALGASVFAAEAGQIALGYARVLAVHIPLGVAIVAALALLAVHAWGPRTGPAPAARS